MPTFTVRRDPYGYACAIDRDGTTILQLAIGSEQNEWHADAVVAALNASAAHNLPSLRKQRDELLAALRKVNFAYTSVTLGRWDAMALLDAAMTDATAAIAAGNE